MVCRKEKQNHSSVREKRKRGRYRVKERETIKCLVTWPSGLLAIMYDFEW